VQRTPTPNRTPARRPSVLRAAGSHGGIGRCPRRAASHGPLRPGVRARR